MMDVLTSVLALIIVGYVGGLVSQLFRLPRIICMILFGIALYPAVHPSVLSAASVIGNPVAGGPSIDVTGSATKGVNTAPFPAQSPASTIRTVALLVALARGGLSVRMSYFKELGVAMLFIAVLPYAFELVVEALIAPSILPESAGYSLSPTPWLPVFASASVWAPLSPSIVVPNMLAFVESGLTEAGRLVLTGAPLEVSTALITEGVLNNILLAPVTGQSTSTALGYIPLYIVGSALYGVAFALAYWAYTKARPHHQVTHFIGKMDPIEPQLVWLCLFLLCYTTSNDDTDTPHLIGLFAALCCAMTTQYLVPEVADALCVSLKPVWTFAESFLFVLTGCVIRPAIDSGNATVLFGSFFALLIIGSLARMVADVIVAIVWQWSILRRSPATWNRSEWADAARRVAFVWVTTMPKATLQASLGPKLAKTFSTVGFRDASVFVAPSAAIAILYMATIGSLLTFSAGYVLARHFQDDLQASAATKGGGSGVPSSPGAEAVGAQPLPGEGSKPTLATSLDASPSAEASAVIDAASPTRLLAPVEHSAAHPVKERNQSLRRTSATHGHALRVAEPINILTGGQGSEDPDLAAVEVAVSVEHKNTSTYTGVQYD